MTADKLNRLFNPKNIAVIGATDDETSVGYYIFKNIVSSKFNGIVFPVNNSREKVQAVKAYHSILDIQEPIDLAIIATPATTVPKIVEECGQKGVPGVVIISAGFVEGSAEGRHLAKDILETAKKYGLRIIGPNCMGFIRPDIHLNASFASKMASPGKIAFISQSGALGTAILDWAIEHNVGFRHFVSIGSMLDVGFDDLIDYFAKDPETKSILIYMESLNDARRFMSAARACAMTKPIIVLKSGRSEEGAKAASSHTGSMAGNDNIFDAAFKRVGIIRVNTIDQLFDCTKALAMQKRPDGNRLMIVTNAGGPGVIATDLLIKRGGQLAEISASAKKKLDSFLPQSWSKSNPVDILGDADAGRFKKALEICLDEKDTDGIMIILTPQAMTDPASVARDIISIKDKENKTVLAVFMGEEMVKEATDILQKGNIPVFKTPEAAVKCFTSMYQYSKNLELIYETPANIPHAFTPKMDANKNLINSIASSGRYTLTEEEAKQLLANYDIPVTKNAIAKTSDEAARLSQKIGFPVVMKISSPDILHKTDVGGVKLDIVSAAEAKKAFEEIMSSAKKNAPKAKILGVFIEKMDKKRYELLIGCKKDRIFGPAIVFGMGGVAVEVFKDVNVGLPPLNMTLAMRLIEDTKVYSLLKGYRNMPGVDIKSIQFLLYKFAYLVMDFPQIKEIDINPFAVDEKGGVVLDAKVILDKDVIGKDTKPYSHMVISPYPKQHVTKFRLRDATEVTLRPIKPEDEPLEAEMFKNLSEETQRLRFFTIIKDVTHDMLVRYTHIDYDREMAIVAELTEKGKKSIIGVVRIIADHYNNTAEFSIVIADRWQRSGLGNKLTDYILHIAKEREIKKVYAYFLGDNNVMKHMFERRGFMIKKQGDSYYAELNIKTV